MNARIASNFSRSSDLNPKLLHNVPGGGARASPAARPRSGGGVGAGCHAYTIHTASVRPTGGPFPVTGRAAAPGRHCARPGRLTTTALRGRKPRSVGHLPHSAGRPGRRGACPGRTNSACRRCGHARAMLRGQRAI